MNLRFITVILLSLCIATILPGHAAAATYSGTIAAGNPASYVGFGPTEFVFYCDENAPTTGVDGQWFDISGAGSSFSLTMDPTLDADVWFYDANCAWINDTSGAQQGLGVTESGSVPAGTVYAVVVGVLGTGSFTLTVS